MSQPFEERSSPQRWIFFLLIAGLVIITALFIVSRLFRYSGPELRNSPFSIETRNRAITIGQTHFQVPENIIRHKSQRQNGPLSRLNLILLWPSLEGFSLKSQMAFSDMSERSRLIYLSLDQPHEPVSSSARLYTIFSEHFRGNPLKGPAGLIGFAMNEKSGYAGEIVYFTPDNADPFVARCVRPVKDNPAFCLRDIKTEAGLQISYRFRPHLLEQWQKLDPAILALIQKLRTNTAHNQ